LCAGCPVSILFIAEGAGYAGAGGITEITIGDSCAVYIGAREAIVKGLVPRFAESAAGSRAGELSTVSDGSLSKYGEPTEKNKEEGQVL